MLYASRRCMSIEACSMPHMAPTFGSACLILFTISTMAIMITLASISCLSTIAT